MRNRDLPDAAPSVTNALPMIRAVEIATFVLLLLSPLPLNSTAQIRESPHAKEFRCKYPRVEIISRQLFNDHGRLVESPVSLTEYHICDEARRESEWGELLNGDADTKTISRYDANGNEIEHEYWIHDELNRKSVSRYDKLDRLIQTVDNDGSKTRCLHKQIRSWCKLFDKDGSISKTWVVTRDSAGREVQRTESQRGRPNDRYVYGYDQRGNRDLEAHYYRADGRNQSSRTVFTFNKQGDLLQKDWYDETGLRTRGVYDYNDKGDPIRRAEYDRTDWLNEQDTIDYESYDQQGNWNKAIETRVISRKGQNRMEIRSVKFRVITYTQPKIAFAVR